MRIPAILKNLNVYLCSYSIITKLMTYILCSYTSFSTIYVVHKVLSLLQQNCLHKATTIQLIFSSVEIQVIIKKLKDQKDYHIFFLSPWRIVVNSLSQHTQLFQITDKKTPCEMLKITHNLRFKHTKNRYQLSIQRIHIQFQHWSNLLFLIL